MLHAAQFALLGLIEGITEFLPISSTGHLILARSFFGIAISNGLAVDAVLQLATTLALIVYFRKDLWNMAIAAFKTVFRLAPDPGEARLAGAIIAGTVPGVLLGLYLERLMETVFRSPLLVAGTLIAGAGVMAFAEHLSHKKKTSAPISNVGIGKGFLIGLFQSIALIPGMSRSGMTISGGLFLGLSRDAAARFGFLLSVPILAGSGAKKLLDLAHVGVLGSIWPELLVGCIVAFVSGFAAIHWLLTFLRTRSLYPFVIYRVVLGVFIFALATLVSLSLS